LGETGGCPENVGRGALRALRSGAPGGRKICAPKKRAGARQPARKVAALSQSEPAVETAPFDVFICYSSADKTTADAVCATLEASGIRCWIAPRDITAGADWSAAIVEAIGRCRLLVLIFSANANESVQIRNEVVQAVNNGLPIVPFRIEATVPSKSLAYSWAASIGSTR
jgi:hypothetical protein